MRRALLLVVAHAVFPSLTLAQRDAPVWESYLDRISVYHLDRVSTSIELVWQKGGGPHEHTEHQIYVLAYLKKNESKILKLAQDPKLMTKTKGEKKGEKKILDVLRAKKLVTVLRTQARKEIDPERNKADPKTARRTSAYPFAFKFPNQKLFDKVSTLTGFDVKGSTNEHGYTWYEQQFKIITFIPVNDSKYADKVSPKNKGEYDFAHLQDHATIAQYFRPLPYVFRFKKIPDGKMLVYIH